MEEQITREGECIKFPGRIGAQTLMSHLPNLTVKNIWSARKKRLVRIGGDEMPYKCENIRLSETQDRRCRLTTEQKDEIVELYSTGLHSLRGLAKRFGVSKSLIHFYVNPDRAAAVNERVKKHWKDYAAHGEERNAIVREHRRYKQRLYVEGKLK
jgi:transposase-like protein